MAFGVAIVHRPPFACGAEGPDPLTGSPTQGGLLKTVVSTGGTTHGGRRWMALTAAAALLLAACGGDDGDPETSADDATTQTSAAGSDATASGDPIKIGFVTTEGGSAIDVPEPRQGAEMAAEYVNKELGGIGGRPIEILACGERGDPASAQSCANEMVEEDVAVFFVGNTGQGDAMVPIVTGAGIPYVRMSGVSLQEIRADGAFAISGGIPGAYGAMAAHARDQGMESFALFLIDVPGLTSAADSIARPAFDEAGVELSVVPIAPGTPDQTPQVSSNADADGFGFIGDPTMCTAFLKAYEALGLEQPKITYRSCGIPDVANAAPDAYEGTLVATHAAVGADTEDAQTYAEVVAEYGGEVNAQSDAIVGYQLVMTLVEVASDLDEITSETVMDALRTSEDIELPVGAGMTFTCDGKAIPPFPSVCSSQILLGTVENGEVGSYEVVDAAELFASLG